MAARHSGEVAGCAAGTAAGETADTRRTDARSSTTRWPVAALEDMLCIERRHVDDLGVRLSDGCRAPRHSKLSPFGPVTTISTFRPPHSEQTGRSRQSRTDVFAPYEAAISARSGSTWWPHVLHHTINRTFAFAALQSAIGAPGGDFTGLPL